MQIAVIGGGAAGFFSALSAKEHHPAARVTIYEKTDKLLSKVKVSGGGRCNVTHHCFDIQELVKHYPRGERPLRKVFGVFNPTHTIQWFEKRGIELKTEKDGRMFPVTDSSQTIIDCLIGEADRLGIGIKTRSSVKKLEKSRQGFLLTFKSGEFKQVDKVIVATGGSPRVEGFNWLREHGHKIESPVPSLFTFNMPEESIKDLMGVVAPNAQVKIEGTKLKSTGPLLITHWGMSGPAILKLSSFGARILNDLDYSFKALVNWINETEEAIRQEIQEAISVSANKKVWKANPFDIPNRLWEFLLRKASINETMTWSSLNKKNTNRLVHVLSNDAYSVQGKTTFKEEFVTCGGVALSDIDMKTMQSKKIDGLYFTGEVLDVDGVTGGFNFQAAWSTGYIAGKLND